ncbi:MAG: methyltransferase domain-containing protein [Candidatus Aminicenantes bacterium]|nr:methyltransferase domain-containing protein [Candidatus Aminicenantes bacterium]
MTKQDFFSRLSSPWDERHGEPEELERLRLFAAHFQLQRGDRILDVGCGSGRLAGVACERIGPSGSLVELDFAPGMIEICRKKCFPGNVTCLLGDAHALPLDDHDFDKVIALALLPHLDDKAGALREFRRVLKPGGLLVVAHQMGREELDRLHDRQGGPVRRDRLPAKPELALLLHDAGFSAVEIQDEPDRYIAWGRA